LSKRANISTSPSRKQIFESNARHHRVPTADGGRYIYVITIFRKIVLQSCIENQNVQDENAIELLGSLLKPKAKEKIFHKLSVSILYYSVTCMYMIFPYII